MTEQNERLARIIADPTREDRMNVPPEGIIPFLYTGYRTRNPVRQHRASDH